MNRLVVIAIGAIVVGCAGPVASAAPSPISSSASPVGTAAAAWSTPASSPTAEEGVARAYIAAISAGDAVAAAALIAAGAKARTSGTAPYETLADPAAVLAFVNASPRCPLQITRISQTGSQVVVEAEVGAESSTSCPVEPGTGIQVPLTILNGLITVIG
jgi:hypothetical protein